ncbi:hypothetical protein ACSNOI_13290 [Actinomadura kijaniata]|uniref:hypothetical protein n=1 Tax=Actinomadura kijaniata TaxID=46161 RepID=UPI003F1A308F
MRLRELVAREAPAFQRVTIRLRIAPGRPGEALVEVAENEVHGGMFGGDAVPADD